VDKVLQRKLTDRQIKDYNTCAKSPQMVLNNFREAYESDGVDDDSMSALAQEFDALAFLGQGRALVGELNEDTVTTPLIVEQQRKEIEMELKTKEHHATQIWETGAQDGIALLTQGGGGGMYTRNVVLAISEHWITHLTVLCTQDKCLNI
jgi:hypothetical protein